MTKPLFLRAVLALVGTGILAGAAVFLGFVVGARVEGGGGEAGAVVAVAGIVGCVALLAWGWWPLAPGPLAAAAALITGLLSVLTTVLAIAVAAEPYEAIMCGDAGGESFCGLGVLLVVPTFGAVVPWTIAGIPGLAALILVRRRRSGRSAAPID